MKIKSTEELQRRLDDDYAWRRKELSFIYTNLISSKSIQVNTNLRIAVVMLYSHWEGFIKNSAEFYLIFVASQKIKLDNLSSNFVALSLKQRINTFIETNKNTVHTQLVDFLLGNLSVRYSLPTENIIKTNSNLNAGVLKEILSVVGIEYNKFELKQNYIDGQLLRLRNSIGHGQDPEINKESFIELYGEITSIMEQVKVDILNNAVLGAYMKQIT